MTTHSTGQTHRGRRPRRTPGTFSNINVKQLDNGRWQARARVRTLAGADHQLARTRDTRQAAVDALHADLREEADLADSVDVDPTTTFAAVVEQYLDEVERTRSPSTAHGYRHLLTRHVLDELGALEVRRVTHARLRRLFDGLADRGYSASTRRGVRAALSGALQLAVDIGLIDRNPVKALRRIEGKVAAPRALSDEEIAGLLAVADADPVAVRYGLPDYIRVMLGTGMRLGESLGLCWSDIDMKASTLRIDRSVIVVGGKLMISGGKSNAAKRTIYQSGDVFDVLMRLSQHADLAQPHLPVFPSRTGSYRWPRSQTAALYRLYAKIPALSWINQPTHVFRKTAATRLRMAGLPDLDIADFMGHEDISTTQKSYVDRRGSSRATAEALSGITSPILA